MQFLDKASALFASLALVATPALASDTVPVHVLNFIRAETDQYFARYVAQGGLGQFIHVREPAPIEEQDIIRLNRDTLYSFAVFDLKEPVTITKPDPEGRFQSMLVFDQDHYVVAIEHEAGTFTFDQDSVGTRYVFAIFRTFMDPEDAADVIAANAMQDAIKVDQSDAGSFDAPNWDQVSLDQTRAQLLALAASVPPEFGSGGMFGAQDEVDPVKHLLGTAIGWAGNPESAAFYEIFNSDPTEALRPFAVTVPADVPVDGFWSITLYNGDGYMEANDAGAYSINNVTGAPNEDGSVTVHFGDCEDGRMNCLPIMEGWNYTVRMYQPGAEILNGSWSFPQPTPVE